MRAVTTLLALLVMTSSLVSQEGEPVKKSKAEAQLETIMQEYQTAMEKWQVEARKQAEAARASGEQPAIRMQPPLAPFIVKLQDAAKEFAGTDDAVIFLTQIMPMAGRTDQKAAQAAADTLTAHHAASPKLADFAMMFQYLPQMVGEEHAAKLIKAIEEQNKTPDVKAAMLLSKYSDTLKTAPVESPEYERAKKELLALMPKLKNDQLKGSIQGALDEREKFGNGAIAPDIVGIDLDGVEFKLSDYKGKVVFLDFWGDW